MCCRHVSSYEACSLLSASRAVVANNNPAPLTTMQRPPPHSHEPCPLFFRIQEIIWCCCRRLSVKKKKNKRKQQVVCETLCTSPLWTKKKKYHRLTKSSQMPFSLVWFLNVFSDATLHQRRQWRADNHAHLWSLCFFLSFFLSSPRA